MTPKFQLTSIQKRYGSRIALELDELTIWSGRIHVLTGANGSGKSTLLNILAFLAEPERGVVAFTGDRVMWKRRELNELRKRVTLLHQVPYLFAGSVFGNLAFGLKLRGIRGEALRERVADSLALVDLAGFEERDVKHLSGGEARRVALARALALQPEILLFDEPLANLDKHSAPVVDGIIASLAEHGVTIVMATHDPRHAERFDGEVIHLTDGRLDHMSAPYNLLSQWEPVPLCQPSTMPAL
jgi:tungstate transport system ATP-binding protein